MLPSTDRYTKTSVPGRDESLAPYLFIVMEGARPTVGGLRCCLRDLDEILFGRGEARVVERASGSRRLTITLPDSTVSARHARIVRQGETWIVEDDGSTNGTFVDGRQVLRETLQDGAILGIGQTVLRLRSALPTPPGTGEFVDAQRARDPVLRVASLLPQVAAQTAVLARVAPASLPVLLLGDTGTGKEVMAAAIHAACGRAGDFVALNCGALPDALVESQLFGHVKGAFSGAARDALGFVRAAHGGTLFLDEIGDLPPGAQVALLRVLQEGEVVPIGAMRPVAVDVRVIAATHRPVERMLEQGDFRRDLFARLQGFVHRLLPLGERREDVGLLVAEQLQRLAPTSTVRLSPEVALALVRYAWPHNVRELVHVLNHALALGQGLEVLELAQLPAPVAAAGQMAPAPPVAADGEPLAPSDALLRAELLDCLARYQGNVAAVARAMNKAPMQIYRWMNRLGLDPRNFR